MEDDDKKIILYLKDQLDTTNFNFEKDYTAFKFKLVLEEKDNWEIILELDIEIFENQSEEFDTIIHVLDSYLIRDYKRYMNTREKLEIKQKLFIETDILDQIMKVYKSIKDMDNEDSE